MQEKDLQDARKIVDTYGKSVKDIENELNGNAVSKEKTEDAQKFEILYQKEKEINDFT